MINKNENRRDVIPENIIMLKMTMPTTSRHVSESRNDNIICIRIGAKTGVKVGIEG